MRPFYFSVTAIRLFVSLVLFSSAALFAQNASTVSSGSVLTPRQSNEISPEVKNLLNYYDKQIYFTENKGQWPANIIYKADFPLGQAIATKNGMMIGTFDPADISARYNRGIREEEAKTKHLPFNEPQVKVKGHGWMMNFLNSSPAMTIETKTKHKDVFNYLGGNSGFISKANNYQEVWYANVYDKVDVRYYPSQEGLLEYDMICKPGFNKDIISIQMDGISKIILNKDGSLQLSTSVGDMSLPAPVAYQVINGQKVFVQAHYVVSNNNVVNFKIGDFDASKTLIIDPIALRWATWINTNSTGENHGHGIWVDPTDGAIYVVARVDGSTDLISVGAFDESANGGIDLIIGKYLEPDNIGESGTRLWQTYVGGSDDDNPYAIELGPDGNLYVTGYTGSDDFPLLGGSDFSGSSIDNRSQNSDNIFVMKINKDGNSIKSAVVGGNGDDGSFDLRFAPDGGIVICGNTRSTNLNTLYGMGSNTNNGGIDVIVFKINSDLSALSWLKNYGGAGTDQATIMVENPDNGDIYLAGYTGSSNFPVTNARQGSLNGSTDGFIQKLKADGTTIWSSYFNGAAGTTTQPLCMEFNTTRGRLYFGGLTGGLASTNESASGVYDNSYNGGTRDFFVASMDTNQNLNGSTYLGGSDDEVNMMGLNVDLNNDVYVFGYSSSNDFPTSSDALQSQLNLNGNTSNNRDKVFLKVSSDLSSLIFSTYYGGGNDDYDPVGERGIKFSNCRIYTIVTAKSNNIPLTEGALNTTKLSTQGIYEPGLVVWANPPDLANNSISGSRSICKGETPPSFTGSMPAYILPNISRNDVVSSYPVSLASATTYQWQYSTDSINWTNVAGGTTQDLDNSLIGPLYQTTFYRRIIGGDACVIAGAIDQSVKIKVFDITGDVHNVTCAGGSNGSITINPHDGHGPYDYDWSNGGTTQTISGLSAGHYSVTVTDDNGCSASAEFDMSESSASISVSCSSTGGNCIKGFLGSACVDVLSGGVEPFTFAWSNGADQSCAENLQDGDYSVTVTDHNGCAASCSTQVHNQAPVDVEETHVDATTIGGSDGSIDITVTGGTGTYTYLWNDGATSADRTGLSAGDYCVTVTDDIGCSGSTCITIGQPDCHCTPPTNITFESLVNDQVQVCWDPQPCAIAYLLQYEWKGHTNWTSLYIPSSSHCTVIDMEGHVAIKVKIATVCLDESTTSFSTTITYKYVAPCTAPSNLSTTNITATSAQFNWTPGTTTTGQRLRYQVVGSSTSIAKGIPTGVGVYVATDLLPSTSYKWSVKGDCWSVWVKFKTLAQKDAFVTGTGNMFDLNVYPNPASDKLNVEIHATGINDQPATIQLINMLGQVMISERGVIADGMMIQTINLNNQLSNGMYMIRVIAGDQSIEKPVVISTNK